MIDKDYILLLLGMGAVTFLPRWFPVFFLSGKKLPKWFVEWLDLIPASILSALLLPSLVTTGVPRQIDLLRLEFFVAFPTFLFAIKTKSLVGTVVLGMALFWMAGRII